MAQPRAEEGETEMGMHAHNCDDLVDVEDPTSLAEDGVEDGWSEVTPG